MATLSSNLVEAAEEQARSFGYFKEDYEYKELVESFIAGAKWQEKLDKETIKTAEDHAFLAGADWQKEQLMKEAVEGIARPDDCEIWVNLVGHRYKFNDGDKVRIIVLPKED